MANREEYAGAGRGKSRLSALGKATARSMFGA